MIIGIKDEIKLIGIGQLAHQIKKRCFGGLI